MDARIVSVSCSLLCGRLSDVITEGIACEPYELKSRARSPTKTTDRQVAGILLCDLCAYFNRMQVM